MPTQKIIFPPSRTKAKPAIALSTCCWALQGFDAVVSVFAPCPAAEIRRVLRCGGALVVASPGPRHLAEFRDSFYDSPRALPPRASTDSDMQASCSFAQPACWLALNLSNGSAQARTASLCRQNTKLNMLSYFGHPVAGQRSCSHSWSIYFSLV